MALLTGVIASILLALNTLFCSVILFSLTLIKLLLPFPSARKALNPILVTVASGWIYGNSAWMHLTQRMDWQVNMPDSLSRDGWYFVICNHQSWVDILILQHTLNGRVPFLKFFLKQELIKVPIMGAAWWALDFPFMKRYSKAYLEKHPEKRGQDVETTRKACEKFRDMPTSVMNFLEGTRMSAAKYQRQQPPFQHLLKPKAGGMAFAMNAMGDQFKSVVDVTIHYPDGAPTFWEFLQGKMTRCVVHIDEKDIPAALRSGDYENDDDYRQQFQHWVQSLWQDKDQLLTELAAKHT
ncbi:acyltransferase [Bacterioplanes sanyensis]|uniref:Acyltransferase n=1 Tax=Bacterioplanes sanyensis TaxID=1249553 RepID=A0A222FMK5_9GAMM|nr:acyltransferase [Bacterioplanes sanyensis]ASP40258.1 acyltransferase [Bacterioplanes sanyensis]